MPLTILPKLLFQIFDRTVSPSLHFKKRKVLLLNFRGLSTNQYLCFFINILGVWLFWNDKRKIQNQQRKLAIEILTCHVDGQGYVEKHFFGCVTRKLKQKIKFLPATLRI